LEVFEASASKFYLLSFLIEIFRFAAKPKNKRSYMIKWKNK